MIFLLKFQKAYMVILGDGKNITGFKRKDLFVPVRALFTGQVHCPELLNIYQF